MGGRFHRRQQIAGSLRRIAAAEIGDALAAIGDRQLSDAEVIHLVRQQLKRLRALIRLPRGQLTVFGEEDRAFRDLGRRLAGAREVEVLGKSFDAMADVAGLSDLGLLRGQLVARTAHPLESPEFGKLLQDEIAPALFAALRRSRKWRFERKGFALIGDGLADSYGAMQWHQARALRHASPANFHQWRKQVKYHANQLALLKPAAPHMITASLKAAARLAEGLGDHHDLDALQSALFDVRSHPDERAALLAAIGSRKASLEAAAFRLGNEIGAERPRDLLRRIRGYWRDWRG